MMLYVVLPNGDLVVIELNLVIELPPLPLSAGLCLGGNTGLSLLALFINAV